MDEKTKKQDLANEEFNWEADYSDVVLPSNHGSAYEDLDEAQDVNWCSGDLLKFAGVYAYSGDNGDGKYPHADLFLGSSQIQILNVCARRINGKMMPYLQFMKLNDEAPKIFHDEFIRQYRILDVEGRTVKEVVDDYAQKLDSFMSAQIENAEKQIADAEMGWMTTYFKKHVACGKPYQDALEKALGSELGPIILGGLRDGKTAGSVARHLERTYPPEQLAHHCRNAIAITQYSGNFDYTFKIPGEVTIDGKDKERTMRISMDGDSQFVWGSPNSIAEYFEDTGVADTGVAKFIRELINQLEMVSYDIRQLPTQILRLSRTVIKKNRDKIRQVILAKYSTPAKVAWYNKMLLRADTPELMAKLDRKFLFFHGDIMSDLFRRLMKHPKIIEYAKTYLLDVDGQTIDVLHMLSVLHNFDFDAYDALNPTGSEVLIEATFDEEERAVFCKPEIVEDATV